MSLNNILKQIQDELAKKDAIRQDVQAAMRKCTRLSKTAIFQMHKQQLEDAETTLKEAKGLFGTLTDLTASYPDLVYMGIVEAAYEEYTEAQILLSLIKKGRFVDNKEISVPTPAYVLGLADVVGELRRQTLDYMRKNEVAKAERNLELMEMVYVELVNLDEANVLVRGLRRKCDVARHVLEATRGDVTIEVRRTHLEDSIESLRKRLEEKRKG